MTGALINLLDGDVILVGVDAVDDTTVDEDVRRIESRLAAAAKVIFVPGNAGVTVLRSGLPVDCP